mgnify:CR=1 FL=1
MLKNTSTDTDHFQHLTLKIHLKDINKCSIKII